MSAGHMVDQRFNVLILCTGNSARSIMAEAIFNTLPDQRFQAYSAGSQPTGIVNPFVIELVESISYPSTSVRSKSWDEFSQANAPQMDFVFTVCDKAAGQTCPVWPGHPISAHWGVEDPASFQGSADDKRREFLRIFHQLRNRIQIFAALPIHLLERTSLQQELNHIGQLPLSPEHV